MQRTWWLLPLLTYILLLFPYSSQSINTKVTNDDLYALLSFKSLITKDTTQALSSWNALHNNGNMTLDFCRWKGVTCGGHMQNRHVIALRLRGLGLVGTISPQVGNLTRLRVLDLSVNNLEGEIPSSLANCFALRTLNLSVNFLSGSIPTSIGHLSKLVTLNFRHNNLTGVVPTSLSNLTTLAIFSVEKNNLHGQIPTWLGNLTTLTDLDIINNSFTGHIPSALGKLSNLVYFLVGCNKLEGQVPPSLFNISSIEELQLDLNDLSGSLPLDIGSQLPKVRALSMAGNHFEGFIPSSLLNASALEYLVLLGNRFQGVIPPNIGIHGNLRLVLLGDNRLQATEPRDWDFLTSLSNCSNLEILDLHLNNLSGVMPNSLTNLSQELTQVKIGGNKIDGTIPIGIGRFHKLTVLELPDNFLTGTIASDIGQLSSLHHLDLSHNRFHGEIPTLLGNLTQLNDLLLFGNFLDGVIPTSIGNLSKLLSLDLSDNFLSGQIPQKILMISSLTKLLNLSNNMLSGSISPQIMHLNNLGIIDLSTNKLSGEIPDTLGSCTVVSFLYLQENLLQGHIPAELKSLSVEDLDLSNNNLTGPIPQFLGDLQFLKRLNLSFNHLYGPVPNKGIFCNATAVSLTSNGMLCGGPPFLQLPLCPSISPHGPSQRQLHVLISCIIGPFALLMFLISACYFIKKPSTIQSNVVPHNTDFLSVEHERISYIELYEATDSFSAANLIGQGSFGSVYKGYLNCGPYLATVAVKVLDLGQRGAGQSFFAECAALRRIQHRNLVKVITVCNSFDQNGDEFKALVLEFIPNGSLDDWLHPNIMMGRTFRRLSLMERLKIALDVAQALEYLHHHIEPPVIHCDIKPSNILIDDDMVAHVSDLGLAKITHVEACKQHPRESSSVGITGTIGYVAPEYGMGSNVSVEGDIYSYGVLLLEMLTGRRPTYTLFQGTGSLPKYIEMAYTDHKLLGIMDSAMAINANTQDIIDLCIAPLTRLGLACCCDAPRLRMKMGDVVKELITIRKACIAHMSIHVVQATT